MTLTPSFSALPGADPAICSMPSLHATPPALQGQKAEQPLETIMEKPSSASSQIPASNKRDLMVKPSTILTVGAGFH